MLGSIIKAQSPIAKTPEYHSTSRNLFAAIRPVLSSCLQEISSAMGLGTIPPVHIIVLVEIFLPSFIFTLSFMLSYAEALIDIGRL